MNEMIRVLKIILGDKDTSIYTKVAELWAIYVTYHINDFKKRR